MKNFLCINSWVSNNKYLSNAEDNQHASVLVEINDELDFHIGDQIVLSCYMFMELHEAAKKFIKGHYDSDVITHRMIGSMINWVDDLTYLSIVCAFNNYSDNRNEVVSEYFEHHPKDKIYDSEEEKSNLDVFFEEGLFDRMVIRVSNVIYDLNKNRRIFELKIEDIKIFKKY